MQIHCFSVWNERGVRCVPQPVLKPKKMGMCPLVNRVCCFPIDENVPTSFAGVHRHRPLFYYELDAKRSLQLNDRKRKASEARMDAEETRDIENTYETIGRLFEELEEKLSICC